MNLTGTTGTIAEVNSDKQLITRAVQVSALHEASLKGNAFAWSAVSSNIATTDCMILVANTSTTQLLVIDHIYARGDIAGNMNCKVCPVTGLTLAGTAITGVNLNPAKGKVALASAWSAETASPATSIIHVIYQALGVNAQGTTSIHNRVDFNGGIILDYNYAFGIDTILEPAAGFEATVIGYYIDKE